MHVFQPDTGAGGEGEGVGKLGRESDISPVERIRAAGLVASSDQPIEVRAMLRASADADSFLSPHPPHL